MRPILLVGMVLGIAAAVPAGAQSPSCPVTRDVDPYTASTACLLGYVTKRDDPLDTFVSVSAEDVPSGRHGTSFAGGVVHALATRLRETGEVAFGLKIATSGSEWLFPSQINFGSPLRTIKLIENRSNPGCLQGSCYHFEVNSALLSSADVRAILAGPDVMPFRIYTKEGNIDGRFPRAELAAVVIAIGEAKRFGLAEIEPIARPDIMKLPAAEVRRLRSLENQ